MPAYIALFVQRPEDGYTTTDTEPMKIIECVTCNWHRRYLQVLWTSNHMPDGERAALFDTGAHARLAHRAMARVVPGWKAV
jgi:hypothetical protein